jgi:5-formyltetrahydrofolate cyclo-ligase
LTTLNDAKTLARKLAAEQRSSAHAALEGVASTLLMRHVFPILPAVEAKVVSGFFPYQSEIDVRTLLGKLAGEGWTTCLPVVVAKDQPLIFRRWYPGELTVSGKWGIAVPAPESPELEPDVLLVPMLAFDRTGYRLGYGGGFYDRTLAKLRAVKPIIAIGVAYAAQEMPEVPHDHTDQRLDYIMTERELLQCA